MVLSATSHSARKVCFAVAPPSNCARIRWRSASICGASTFNGLAGPGIFLACDGSGGSPVRAAVDTRRARRKRALRVSTAARTGLPPDPSHARKMPGPAKPLKVLAPQIEAERQRIRAQFDGGATAKQTLRALCEVADNTIQQIFAEVMKVHESPDEGLALLALGGYGRRMLFPYSDLDLLFLFENEKTEAEFRPFISEFSRTMWDLGFRVSSAGRTIDECKRIEEDNAEFHLALLDRRFLSGDQGLFDKLDNRVLPPSEKQSRSFLFSQLHRLTKERLARYGNTIFHLEPNVKEAPGGLRDYQAAFWFRQIL